ncbi:MAG: hypothetical protein ACI3YC_04840 [Alloprevotella sp.]
MRTAMHAALLAVILSFTSCGSRSDASDTENPNGFSDEQATQYYMLRANGQFDEYVAAMQSCDSTTEAYRSQMARLLKHHEEQIRQAKGGTSGAEVLRKFFHKGGTVAVVFLNVTFKDGSSEEVIQTMVFDGENWRLK